MTDKIEFSIPEVHFVESTDRKGGREFYAWCMINGQIHSNRHYVIRDVWEIVKDKPGFTKAIRHDLVHELVNFLFEKGLV